jgi:ABC-type lipoprotein release transport system permease subunit
MRSPLPGLLARGLRGRPLRAALTALGVALCALLTVVLFAAHRSLAAAVRTYPGRAGADLWVAPYGTDNLVRSTGVLAWELSEEALEVPGVAAADPILRAFVTAESEAGGRRATLLAIGYRLPDGLGGPPPLREGRLPRRWDEVVLDRAAAARLGTRVGDGLRVGGLAVTVVGLTTGTNLLATQFLFGDLGTACRAAGLPGRVSFVAVRVGQGADPEAVRRALLVRLAGTSVLTRDAFVAANLREVSAGLLPLLALLVALGLAVASVLVALLAQGLVEERREDLAVLLALGAAPRRVGAGLLRGVVGLVAAGSAAGAGLAVLLALALDRMAPAVELQPRLDDVAVTLALFLVAGALGAALPVARLRRVDPLEAFRS